MRAIPLIVLSLLASPAAAEVVSAGPNGFHVRQSVQIVIPTDAAYAGFGRVATWWNKDHTYSGLRTQRTPAQCGGCPPPASGHRRGVRRPRREAGAQ